MASYPSSVWSPTENTGTGQTIQTGYFQDPYNEVVAIEGGLLNGFQHAVKFASDNTYDIGAAGANRPRNIYVATAVIAPGANPAQSGFLRFPNNPGTVLGIRNSGNTGDIAVAAIDGSGNVTFGAGITGAAITGTGITGTTLTLGTNPSGTGLIRLSYAAGGIYFRNQANSLDYQAMDLATIGANNVLAIGTGNNVQGIAIGTANIATNATFGWPYIPTSAGAPTGVPGGVTGFSPIQWNDTNRQLDVYSGGASAWMAITPTSQANTNASGTATTTSSAWESTAFGVSFTPKSSGRVLVLSTSPIALNATGATGYTAVYYTTGSIPVANAAVTGTQVPGSVSGSNSSASGAPYMIPNIGLVTGLTVGTAYNFYVAFNSGNNTAQLTYGGAGAGENLIVIEF